ncbi:MAG: InlB B-repeat-containing protein [Acidimicrobiales bacterium]
MSLGVVVIMFAGVAVAAPYASAQGTITQTPSPQTDTIDVAGSAAYSSAISYTGNSGPVTFSGTGTVPGLTVDSEGDIGTTGTLPVSGSPYTISGTDTDGTNTGTWTFILTVTADPIFQSSATTGTIDVGGSTGYNTTVATTGATGPVTFSVTSSLSTPGLRMDDSTGEITTTGSLPVSGSPYTISGNDSDTDGDSGSWSYSLTVTADPIVQGSPTSDSIAANNSATFTSTLNATSGFVGTVTFATATPGFTINSGDQLASTGALASSGTPYTISGSDSDAYGDTGTWTFALTVEPSGTVVSINQTSATTGTTTSAASATFVSGPIAVENNVGPVTFVTTVSNSALSVSSAGNITTTGLLKAGKYTASGTDSDTRGDVGTWTYTLTVTAVVTTVTFDANGGAGSMAPENASIPTALALNTFARSGYSFVDWNTAANGSGTKYANGASYPFNASITLYAQWKMGKAVTHTVMFNANAGSGSMAPEHENTPTGLTVNAFTRAGYTFVDWNTAANGTGDRYANGATYSFKSSVVLFAQWKKTPKAPTFTVTFNAHGGKGTMAAERHATAQALSADSFTRAGYTFVDWNTAANGSGARYANGAIYPFTASITLFAQWKVHHVAVPPATNATATIGPFALKTSILSSALEVQISNLADEIKANHDTKVALVGYGDKLTKANELNEAIWAANFALSERRASAVDTYLKHWLNVLGIKGVTVSSAGNGSAAPGSGGSQANSNFVIASLS